MPLKLEDFQDLVGKVEVVFVKPQNQLRQELGAQAVKVALMYSGNRYVAVFFKKKINDQEKIKTGETFRNGNTFDEYGHIRIPEIPFAALARRAAAILNEQ